MMWFCQILVWQKKTGGYSYLLNILWAGSYFYKADSIIIESCHIYVIFEAAPEILLLIAYA